MAQPLRSVPEPAGPAIDTSEFDAHAPQAAEGAVDRILADLKDADPDRLASLHHVLTLKGGRLARQKFFYSADTIASTLRDWGYNVSPSTVKTWRNAHVA